MKTLTFRIPLYDFNVRLVQMEISDTKKDLMRELRWAKVKETDVDSIIDTLKRGARNGGDTWRNFEICKIAVIFYPMENEETRAEVYSHEKRHIEDRVMEWANVKDIESSGLLSGFLGRMFYRFTKLVTQ